MSQNGNIYGIICDCGGQEVELLRRSLEKTQSMPPGGEIYLGKHHYAISALMASTVMTQSGGSVAAVLDYEAVLWPLKPNMSPWYFPHGLSAGARARKHLVFLLYSHSISTHY